MADLGTVPDPVVELIGDAELVPVAIGRSDAQTCWVERPEGRWVMKLRRGDGLATSLVAEAERMRWLAPHVAVPEVVGAGDDGDTEWLLVTALPGSDATDPVHRRDVAALVRLLGRGLREFHDAVPVHGCPFDASTATALESARARLEAGRVDESDFAPLYLGMSAAELFEVATASLPPATDDLVVLHGDYCVPNVVIDGAGISGYVDLGRVGVGDRHRDLGIAARSIAHNFGGEAIAPFFDAYGIEPDLARLDFYVMLDELL